MRDFAPQSRNSAPSNLDDEGFIPVTGYGIRNQFSSYFYKQDSMFIIE